MAGNIHNRNVRFYEEREADSRAWEILHSEAVRTFSSQNDFIIQAVNDFYDRHLAILDDPYLERREKEDAFADRIVEKVEQKVLGNLSQLIGIYLLQQQNVMVMGRHRHYIPAMIFCKMAEKLKPRNRRRMSSLVSVLVDSQNGGS